MVSLALYMQRKKLHASKESPIKKATKHIARNVVNAVTEQVAKVPVESYFQWYQRGLLDNPYMFKGLTSTTLKMLSDMTGQLISEGKVVSFRTMVSFGMFGFFFGLIQHEASHSALSSKPWINYVFRYALIPWACPKLWYQKHSIKHHQYTNTILDEDFNSDNYFVRHHLHSRWRYIHKFQIITITLYSFIITFFFSIGYISIIQLFLVSLHYYIHSDFLRSLEPFMLFGITFIFFSQLNHIQIRTTPKTIMKQPKNFVEHQKKCCC